MAKDNRKMLQDALASAGRTRTSLLMQAQLALAQQLDTDASPEDVQASDGEQYLVFSLYDCELAVKAEWVQAVERLVDVTTIPNVAPWVRGVMHLRGSIVSVVDLRTFLGLEQIVHGSQARLLLLQQNDMTICFVVDGVSEMLFIPDSTITRGNILQAPVPQWALPDATGYALLGTRGVVLLDAVRLLFSDKMQRYELQGLEAL